MTSSIDFAAFCAEWLGDIRAGEPSTTELGHRFGRKLLCQWLDIDDSSEDLVYCDGAGDGGIDIAYLQRGEGHDAEGDGRTEGHTWFLVQSKFGSAFAGPLTLLEEAQKIIDTLDGKRTKLSSLSQALLERLGNFRRQASELDRIVLVFGTVEPLSDNEKRVLGDVRSMARGRLGSTFDVEAVSVETVFRRAQEAETAALPVRRVPLAAKLMSSGADLLVGAVSLLDVYAFLQEYRAAAGDLDELYEKNVRRFLGSRGRVNKSMQQTLKDAPERFGLYNNGITIVVADFKPGETHVELTDPYVVNGCQTTRTIWEVCHQRLEAGGTGADPVLDAWKKRAGEGSAVVKIVKVGLEGEDLLREITRYTNTQNAVREKDFLALTSDFKTWAKQMAEAQGIFLEVQRGGWDSQRAMQKQNPSARQFSETANAFDLLKIYGAGWLGEAGTAYGSNKAFVPGGTIFKRIINADTETPFGADDLYAAYRLQRGAETFGFGRGAEKPGRRQTKLLFYMVVVDLLRDVLVREQRASGPKDITKALLKIFASGNEAVADALLDAAINAIDEYMTPDMEDCIYNEPAFSNDFGNDLGGILKWEQLGKTEESSPRFRSLLAVCKKTMGKKQGSTASDRERIASVVA
ncbi:MAG TPA: AIPR family protein [Polyangiaceae bacterium]